MSLKGHLGRGHVDGMSAIAPIATELLREGNGRKGPTGDMTAAVGHRSGLENSKFFLENIG